MRSFGTIRKQPNGKYIGRYRVAGKYHYTPVRPRKEDVQYDLAKIEVQIRSGTYTSYDAVPKQDGRYVSLKDFFYEWYYSLEEAGFSPNTRRSYRSCWNAHILPLFGDRALTEITGADFDVLRKHLVKEGKSDTTIMNVQLAFSAGLTGAVDAGLIETNPAVIKAARKKVGVSQRRTSKALTGEQLNAVIAHAEPYWKAAIALAGWGALRYGEIAALTRGDISENSTTVTVERAAKRDPDGKIVIGPPKSVAGYRTVVLPDHAAAIVATHLDHFTGPEPDALLFHRANGALVADSVMRHALHRAEAAAGVPRTRFHDLRHTGLTEYGRAGATLADLMRRAGHADPKTVMIYQHSDEQRDRELANRMNPEQ